MDNSGPCEVSNDLRREIVRRARDKKLRTFEFEPTVWNPTQVLNPESKIPFTDITAWHFIADQLESGCHVQAVELHRPKGEIGYEMLFQGLPDYPKIYVKVRLHKHRIIGRSFHNSTGGEI